MLNVHAFSGGAIGRVMELSMHSSMDLLSSVALKFSMHFWEWDLVKGGSLEA